MTEGRKEGIPLSCPRRKEGRKGGTNEAIALALALPLAHDQKEKKKGRNEGRKEAIALPKKKGRKGGRNEAIALTIAIPPALDQKEKKKGWNEGGKEGRKEGRRHLPCPRRKEGRAGESSHCGIIVVQCWYCFGIKNNSTNDTNQNGNTMLPK